MAKLLNIITNPDENLRKKSDKISLETIKTKEFGRFLDDMILTMLEKDGIGLAAPQIGRNISLFTVNTKDGPICVINPEITKKSFFQEYGEEGCLSVPGVFGQVKRHKSITCDYVDRDGKTKRIKASGLLARVFQHEYDHLQGILFIDKAKDLKKLK